MKPLVIFYSRTGTTKKVAEAISKDLNCDIEEIVDMKDRKGPMGYLIAGKDAATKALTEIKKVQKLPDSYDIVIIGTPVWAFTMASAIRTYINKNRSRLKKVAFFCTQGGSGSKRTFRDMEKKCGKKAIASLELTTREVIKGEHIGKVKQFVHEINKQS